MLQNQIAQSVIDHGISLGADFAELFVEKSQTNTVSTLSNQVQSVESGIDFGIGLRLVYGTKVLYGYTNRPEESELKRIMSELAAKDLRNPLVPQVNFDFRKTEDIHLAIQTLTNGSEVESKVAYLLMADTAARSASNMISQTRGSCRQKEQFIEIFNSEGLHTEDIRNYIRTSFTAIASDGSEQATGSWNDGGLLGWEIKDALNAEKTGAEATRQALVNLGAKPCPSGRMPVVIGNGFGGVIFHEACGHLLETTQIERGTTPFSDQVGSLIAHPSVTAVDEGLSGGAFGSLSMDDEGMEPERTVLIKDGVLQRFISDRAGELRTGHKRTGSGRRQSHAFAAGGQGNGQRGPLPFALGLDIGCAAKAVLTGLG